MEHCKIIKIRENPGFAQQAAQWFNTKWNIPLAAYMESINDCINGSSFVPQWYIVVHNNTIVAGAGVIENDFHNRKDLAPNVCAVYVEEQYRRQGIAGRLLDFICDDFYSNGIDTLYLLTDHTGFYERYDWQFLCMVQGDGEERPSRMYVHKI